MKKIILIFVLFQLIFLNALCQEKAKQNNELIECGKIVVNSVNLSFSNDQHTKDPLFYLGLKEEIPISQTININSLVNGEIFVGSKAYEKIYGANFLIGLRLGSALRKGIEFRDNIQIYTDILSGLSIFNFPKTDMFYAGNISKIAMGFGFKNYVIEISIGKTNSDVLNLTSFQIGFNYSWIRN